MFNRLILSLFQEHLIWHISVATIFNNACTSRYILKNYTIFFYKMVYKWHQKTLKKKFKWI